MTPQAQPDSDPLIDEVRARRRELFAACDNDLRKLAERIQRCEAEHPEKVINRREQLHASREDARRSN